MRLVEEFQIVNAIVPVDLQTGANAGDYVSLKNYRHCTVLITTGIGTAGDDPVISQFQAKTVAGGDEKALNISTIWHKVGATAVTAVGEWTKVTQTAAATYDSDAIDGAENVAMFILEIDADDLDVDNGFDCYRVHVADVGSNAMLGCATYILSQPRFPAIEAITD